MKAWLDNLDADELAYGELDDELGAWLLLLEVKELVCQHMAKHKKAKAISTQWVGLTH